MAYKIKRITIIAWVFVVLSAGAFGTYQYKDAITDSISPSLSAIVEKVTPGYTSEYTMEEMSEKIFSHQQKSTKKLRKAYNDWLTVAKDARITWGANMSLDMNSSFWWGNGKMNLSGLDFQYKKDNIDISFDELSFGWKLEAIGMKLESSWLFKNIHLMKNGSGSYLKIENSVVEWDMLPWDVLMTLNQLWKQGKYISFSDNPLYEVFEESLKSQTDDSQVTLAFDFMENEKIFVVNKQEDTKYSLVPSQSFCKLMKNERAKTEGDSDTMFSAVYEQMTYELFKDDYVDCSETEYKEFVENFMKSTNHEVNEFYIEYSKAKTHYVFDMSIVDNTSSSIGEKEDTIIKIWSDMIISLGSIEKSTTYLNIESDSVTWSWIILETDKDTFDMLFDIDMPEYELDTNISFSGTTDSYSMVWDYSVTAADSIDDYWLKPYEGVKFSWSMKWTLNEWVSTFTMENNFNEPENGVTGKLSIDSNSKLVDSNNTWDMIFAWEFTLWDGASPVSWKLTAKWDTTTTNERAKWDIIYKLDIPNIASGEYLLDYDLEVSEGVDADFKNPENIISEQDLEKMLKKNKIIADKKKVLQIQKKMEDLKNWKNTFWTYEIDAMNSKVTSDLRNLVSALETKRTRDATWIKDFIKGPKVIKRNSAYTVYSWTMNFAVLGQNGTDFTSPYTWKDYELRVIDFKEEWNYPMYEIWGDRFEEETFKVYSIWNYYTRETGTSMPKKLFDIEVK